MTASARTRAFQRSVIGYAAHQLPAVDRIRAFLALDELELVPIHDGLDHLRPEEARGKHIVAYELHDVGSKRGKVGRLSLTFVNALARMHPAKIAPALCLGHNRGTPAKNRKGHGR